LGCPADDSVAQGAIEFRAASSLHLIAASEVDALLHDSTTVPFAGPFYIQTSV
jgi:hypothetical protein